jgi:hypothetical protein
MSDEHSPLDEPVEFDEARRRIGEYLATIVHMIRREVEVATNAQIATRALVQAIRDVFPEREAQFLAAFEKHFDYESEHGEMAVKARQVVEELDRTFHQAKYGS